MANSNEIHINRSMLSILNLIFFTLKLLLVSLLKQSYNTSVYWFLHFKEFAEKF